MKFPDMFPPKTVALILGRPRFQGKHVAYHLCGREISVQGLREFSSAQNARIVFLQTRENFSESFSQIHWTCRRMVSLNGASTESRVDAYEIRIVKKESKAPVIYACSHVSDHAAIRRAQSLVEDGDLVEVWRGLDCVYSRGQTEPWARHKSATKLL